MISAQFRIQLPADLWITQLSRAYPNATFRLLSGFRADDRAVELGEVLTDSPDEVVEAMRDRPEMTAFELLEADDGRALVKYETTTTALYEFVEGLSLTVEFPLLVRNGRYQFDLTGTREEMEHLRDALDDSAFDYELLSVVGTTDRESLLTDRQREVLETAAREGYFEVPRDCTLADVAAALDVDKSTASTVLRRGEGRLVTWFLSGPDER